MTNLHSVLYGQDRSGIPPLERSWDVHTNTWDVPFMCFRCASHFYISYVCCQNLFSSLRGLQGNVWVRSVKREGLDSKALRARNERKRLTKLDKLKQKNMENAQTCADIQIFQYFVYSRIILAGSPWTFQCFTFLIFAVLIRLSHSETDLRCPGCGNPWGHGQGHPLGGCPFQIAIWSGPATFPFHLFRKRRDFS